MAYTAIAKATTIIREINHRLYLLTLKMIHSSVPAITFGTGPKPPSKWREEEAPLPDSEWIVAYLSVAF
jgi:hypothetical protein